MFIAIKELRKEKLRFGMIISIIVLISFLVYFLSSLAFGLSELNRTAIDHWKGDGVLIKQSANKNLYSSSIDLDSIENLKNDNVEYISITNSNATIKKSDSISLVFLGINDLKSSILPDIISGENIQDDFDVLISNNIKDKHQVEIGDKIKISSTKREFTIKGFTEDSNYNTLPVVYGKSDMVSQVMMNFDTSNSTENVNSSATENMPKRISFILVKDKNELNMKLYQDDLIYISLEDLIQKLPGYKAQVLTFGLMIASLSIIVAIIVGIFMFILTMQKKSIFAVLKIQGYQNSTIIESIIFQILILTLIGLAIGFALNITTITYIPKSVPVLLNGKLSLIVSLFILLSSLLGGIFSAYSVLKIDPMDAL